MSSKARSLLVENKWFLCHGQDYTEVVPQTDQYDKLVRAVGDVP